MVVVVAAVGGESVCCMLWVGVLVVRVVVVVGSAVVADGSGDFACGVARGGLVFVVVVGMKCPNVKCLHFISFSFAFFDLVLIYCRLATEFQHILFKISNIHNSVAILAQFFYT